MLAGTTVVLCAGLGFGLWTATDSSGARPPIGPSRPAVAVGGSTTTAPSTTVPSEPTTTYKPRLSITAPIPATATVAIPGGTMALNAGLVSFIHVVQPGENLSFIASWYFQFGGEPALYAFNQGTIGPNASLIFAGYRLMVTMPVVDVPKVSPAWPPLQKLEQSQ